jgi:hypothetical protein
MRMNLDWLERVNVRDVCWLAGFLDADGNISIFKRKTWLAPSVGFTNTNKQIIDNVMRILDALGVGYNLSYQDRGERINAKPAWSIKVESKPRVLKLLNLVRDDLVGKQTQADLVLKWCELPSATTHKLTGGGVETRHPDGYWSIREEVQRLNHRGIKPFVPS